jgi:hypothetical protein
MDESPHLTIGYLSSGESRMQVKEGWSPSYELKSPWYGELIISMAGYEGLGIITSVRIQK